MVPSDLKLSAKEDGIVIQQLKPLPVALAYSMSTSLSSSCSTSDLTSYLCPWKAVEDGASAWPLDNTPMWISRLLNSACPAQAAAENWGVNQRIEDLSLFLPRLSLFLSFSPSPPRLPNK